MILERSVAVYCNLLHSGQLWTPEECQRILVVVKNDYQAGDGQKLLSYLEGEIRAGAERRRTALFKVVDKLIYHRKVSSSAQPDAFNTMLARLYTWQLELS